MQLSSTRDNTEGQALFPGYHNPSRDERRKEKEI